MVIETTATGLHGSLGASHDSRGDASVVAGAASPGGSAGEVCIDAVHAMGSAGNVVAASTEHRQVGVGSSDAGAADVHQAGDGGRDEEEAAADDAMEMLRASPSRATSSSSSFEQVEP